MYHLPQDMTPTEFIDLLADQVAIKVANRIETRLSQQFISRDEFAQRHGIGLRSVDRAIKQGRLESKQVGRRRLISADAKIHQ